MYRAGNGILITWGVMMKLVRANVNDCDTIWSMQTEAFHELLEKYQDYETSPGNESRERIKEKLSQEFTYFYYIYDSDDVVGAIRVVDNKDGSRKRVVERINERMDIVYYEKISN